MSRWLLVLLLVLLASGCSSPGAHDGHGAHGAGPPSARPQHPAGHGAPHASHGPSGYAPLTLSPPKAAAIGLATAVVDRGKLGRSATSVGVLALDETRTSHVHAKVRGVVEGVFVDFLGKPVRRGQPLCAIYSQSVLAAQLEFIAVLKQQKQLSAASKEDKDGDLGLGAVIDGARRRLQLWDVPKGQIERLERDLTPARTFALSAPRAGVVLARQAYVGSYVEPGTELYVISDTSQLWALIDLYEADVPSIHIGTPVRLAIEGIPAPVEAIIDFLPPTVDEATRTLKARASLPNPRGELRPGAFLSASFSIELGEGLSVPEDAVIRTGKRSIVFVVHGEHVTPREVRIGPLVGGRYRVEQGLSEGERVATGAQFLIDSESRLRATSTPGGAHAGH
ncbi:MAG: efflux RND transporter periplasmic adaptor subunit [Polyangiaceae bacterium]|nr:efflux RND transporter periplasmic adaptor subunit [Polyangiaceae bacterium]